MSDNPMPFQEWNKCGEYPNLGVLYNWTRPGSLRDELMAAGVLARINGRWLFNPPKWREYCANQFRHRGRGA
jgi:hypothetical protein